VGPVTDKSLEVDDPYELIGVSVPLAPGVDADRELARAFVEEFALSGWSPARIAQLFAEPTNGKAHEIWQRRGAALIDEVIGEVFGPAAAIDGIER
jgi:hypothetical protein